jgi:hypothetical protein
MCTLQATKARRRSRNSILRQLQLGRLPQGQRNANRIYGNVVGRGRTDGRTVRTYVGRRVVAGT